MRALKRLNRLFRRPGVLGTLCAAYALFSVVPHFDLLSHSHQQGEHPHHHEFLSAHDVALERAVLQAVDNAGAPQAEIARAQAVKKLLPLAPGSEGLAAKSASKHSHYQEDPNLLAQGQVSEPPSITFVPLSLEDAPVLFVSEPGLLEASARAPPRA